MAWATEVTEVVRYMIGDVDSPQKYTDERITKAASISASALVSEITFPNNYQVEVSTNTITPDPTEVDPKDYDFINLLALKTSCLILQGEMKIYAGSSIRVVDGPSTIDVGSIYSNTQQMLANLIRVFESKKHYYMMGSSGYGKAITTPSTYPGY